MVSLYTHHAARCQSKGAYQAGLRSIPSCVASSRSCGIVGKIGRLRELVVQPITTQSLVLTRTCAKEHCKAAHLYQSSNAVGSPAEAPGPVGQAGSKMEPGSQLPHHTGV